MINQLLRLGALIATGRFLKPRLKGLLCIAVVWITLWFVHSEYVSYVELSGDTSFVLKATLIKTGLYALSIALYVLLVERKLWPKPVRVTPVKKSVGLQAAQQVAPTPLAQGNDDGFDFLRSKKKLKNPADTLLKK